MHFRFADCDLDTDRQSLSRAGETVPVEPQVFDLIRLLVENPDRVVTRDEIVEAVWGGRIVSESAISARIAAARKAVGDDGKRQAVIRTVARRGLQMVAEVTLQEAQGTASGPTGAAERSDVQRIRYVRLPSGHSMAYTISGEGPPVILVEHARTDLEAEWRLPFERARFEALSRRNTLVRFDAVGSGQSDRRADRAEIPQQAEHIGWLADALALETFALSSHSGGCNALIHYAAHNPGRVTRLAMTGGYAEGRSLRNHDAADVFDPLRAMALEGRSNPEGVFYDAMLLSYRPEGPLESVKAYSRMMQDAVAPEFELRIRDIVNNHSSMDLLPRISCPALILHSRHDAVHPLTEAHKLAGGIPNAELVVLECANHIPWLGNAAYDSYLATLTDFLAD